MQLSGSATLNQNQTRYRSLTAPSSAQGVPTDPTNAADHNVEFATIIDQDCAIGALEGILDYTPNAGQSLIATLVVNGVETDVTITIDESGTTKRDDDHTYNASKGDIACYKYATSSGFNGFPQNNLSLVIQLN